MRLSSNPHRKDAWSNVESPEIARAWIEVSSNKKSVDETKFGHAKNIFDFANLFIEGHAIWPKNK